MGKSSLGLALVAAVVCACDASSLEDELFVELADAGEPILVDLTCAADVCAEGSEFDIVVGFDPDAEPLTGAKLSIRQYRLDYDLPGVAQDVPFFAAECAFEVGAKEPVVLGLIPAGTRQRAVVEEFAVGWPIDGTAKITLAGYDHNDERVLLRAEIPIRFGDF